jgi:hypothetical protein
MTKMRRRVFLALAASSPVTDGVLSIVAQRAPTALLPKLNTEKSAPASSGNIDHTDNAIRCAIGNLLMVGQCVKKRAHQARDQRLDVRSLHCIYKDSHS